MQETQCASPPVSVIIKSFYNTTIIITNLCIRYNKIPWVDASIWPSALMQSRLRCDCGMSCWNSNKDCGNKSLLILCSSALKAQESGLSVHVGAKKLLQTTSDDRRYSVFIICAKSIS